MCSTNISLPPPKKAHIYIISTYLSNCLIFLTVDSPKITQHPESKSVAAGASTNFTVEASGDDLRFQWKQCLVKNDVGRELSEEADLAVSKLVRNVVDSKYFAFSVHTKSGFSGFGMHSSYVQNSMFY